MTGSADMLGQFGAKTGTVRSSTSILEDADDHICTSEGASSSQQWSVSQQQSGAAASISPVNDAMRSCPYSYNECGAAHTMHAHVNIIQTSIVAHLRGQGLQTISDRTPYLPHFEFMSRAALSSLPVR